MRTGLVILAAFGFTALAAPWLAPHDPLAADLGRNYAPSSWAHPLGTDHLGRDTLSRLIFGARLSLTISLVAIGSALVVGAALGLAAAWRSGAVDAVIGQVVDVMLAFPDILLAIAIVAILGRGSTATIVAVAAFAAPTFARITRSAALSVVALDYVDAARAAGASPLRILARHVLPNCLSPVVAHATVMLGSAILIASGLSFLGLGVQPPDAEWGAMLTRGRELLYTSPAGAIAPGVAITLAVLGFSLTGDGLREVFGARRSQR
jgi:peptide/nickel transport system permease protein